MEEKSVSRENSFYILIIKLATFATFQKFIIFIKNITEINLKITFLRIEILQLMFKQFFNFKIKLDEQ